MPDAVEIDDTPNELLLTELVQSHAWRQVQARILQRRDQMVASLAAGEDCTPRTIRGPQGDVAMASEDAGTILARIMGKLGYIRALNEMAATPDKLLEGVRANKETLV